MWSLEEEQYVCPEEFQDRLTQVGGVNRYDDPNFIIRWGSGGEPESLFRAGGTWEIETAPYTGYRWLKVCPRNCWILMMWEPPESEGVPESFYVKNFCADTGLSILGEYPYKGRYSVVAPLEYTEMVNGQLKVEMMPLSSLLVDLVVPTILDAKEVSLVKRKAIYEEIKAKEDEAMKVSIGDSLHKGRLAFGSNPVSYAGQQAKSMAIEEKARKLKNNLNSAMEMAKHLGQGLFTK